MEGKAIFFQAPTVYSDCQELGLLNVWKSLT